MPILELDNHQGSITYFEKLFDGRIISCSSDKTIRIWDTVDGVRYQEKKVLYGHTSEVRRVRYLPDGKIISIDSDFNLFIWQKNSSGEYDIIDSILCDECGVIIDMFVLDNGRIVITGEGGIMSLEKDQHGKYIQNTADEEHILFVNAVGKLPDGKLVTGGSGNRIVFWEWDSQEIRYKKHSMIERNENNCEDIHVLPDGRIIVSGSYYGIEIWQQNHENFWECSYLRPGEDIQCLCVRALSNGQILAGYKDGVIRVWGEKVE